MVAMALHKLGHFRLMVQDCVGAKFSPLLTSKLQLVVQVLIVVFVE